MGKARKCLKKINEWYECLKIRSNFQAYANLVEKLNWKSLVIVYENEDSLVKLQEVLKLPNSFDGIKITMRQLYTDTDDQRPLLKEIKKSGETRIILVGFCLVHLVEWMTKLWKKFLGLPFSQDRWNFETSRWDWTSFWLSQLSDNRPSKKLILLNSFMKQKNSLFSEFREAEFVTLQVQQCEYYWLSIGWYIFSKSGALFKKVEL